MSTSRPRSGKKRKDPTDPTDRAFAWPRTIHAERAERNQQQPLHRPTSTTDWTHFLSREINPRLFLFCSKLGTQFNFLRFGETCCAPLPPHESVSQVETPTAHTNKSIQNRSKSCTCRRSKIVQNQRTAKNLLESLMTSVPKQCISCPFSNPRTP